MNATPQLPLLIHHFYYLVLGVSTLLASPARVGRVGVGRARRVSVRPPGGLSPLEELVVHINCIIQFITFLFRPH